MGISTPGGGGGRTSTVLSEINVTPLVDVMLVLLIIFMITSSVETIKAEQERERMRRQQQEEEQLKTAAEVKQQVPIQLPKVNSEAINLSEEKKLVLSLDDQMRFFLGDTLIADCGPARAAAPPEPTPVTAPGEAAAAGVAVPQWFRSCVTTVEEKLVANAKLREDQELYLRADHGIDYGMVLMVMARVRKAGITKFGLVAEPELEQ